MKKFASLFFTIILMNTVIVFADDNSGIKGGEWTILDTYEVPGKASGLAWDGQFVYFGQYSSLGNQIHRLDPTSGDYEFVCNGPMEDAFGLTWDGQYLWSTDHPGSYDPGIAYQFDLTGTVNHQFECPATYMGGIASDNGLLWLAAYYDPDGWIYLSDNEGNTFKDFATPGAQPWDICLQDEFLWIADYNDDMLYKVDTISGALIESHACENIKPTGIVWDGQYLWYLDGPLSSPSTLYKVDLGGAGTPEINVPQTSWDYGNVAIGDSATWGMMIHNIGTADLEIENLIIQNAVPVFCWEYFPQTIAPGDYLEVDLIFRPTEIGALSTIITIESNDPVTPTVDVDLFGESVISGPSINVPVTNHSYGYVRVNAWTGWHLEIGNIGDENLVVDDIESDNPSFTVFDNVVFPLTIAPLENIEVGIWFHPEEETQYTGTLTINNNDPQNPAFEVTIDGTGLETDYPIGSFMWQYDITTGWDHSPKAIAPIQDVTGDGVGDVIIGSEDNFIRCFNGNAYSTGDVIWEYEIYAGDVFQQNNLSICEDVNNDGYQDVAAGTSGGDRAVRMFCGKTGALIWIFETSCWGDGGWVYQVDATADYTGDGIPDVLACAGDDSADQGPKRTFCLDGTDGSLLWDYFLGGPGFSVIAIEDVNGDDIPDVFTGASNEDETQGLVVCINGESGSALWSETVNGSSVWGLVQLDDINGDGVKDVAAGDFQGYYFAWDGTNGDELFDGSIGGTPLILRLEALKDVNSDGYADILFATSSSNCIVVSGYDGSTIWLAPLQDKAWNVDRISDISGDGINDVLVGTLFQSNYVYFLDGVSGDDLSSTNYGEAVDAISAIPDINGDGSMEMVAGGRQGKVVCYSGGLNAVTAVEQAAPGNSGLKVECSPNPFHGETSICIDSEEKINCNICIYTAGGTLVHDFGMKTIDNESINLYWNGTGLNNAEVLSGLYFLILTDGRHSKTVKLIKQ